MTILGGPSIQDAIALAQRMATSPADAVAMASQLVETIRALPPSSGQLVSRPKFDRATLFTLGCSFENVEPTGQVPPQIIRCQHDVWVRGVQVQVYPSFGPFDADLPTLSLAVQTLRALRFTTGNNGRGLAMTNWRLDSRQGFISSGPGEVLAPAAIISGDGCFSAAKDWMLQKDQTLEIRLESLFADLNLGVASTAMLLRWAVVAFWVEETDQPSQQ